MDELPLIGVTPAISSGADQVASHLLQKAGSVATWIWIPKIWGSWAS